MKASVCHAQGIYIVYSATCCDTFFLTVVSNNIKNNKIIKTNEILLYYLLLS